MKHKLISVLSALLLFASAVTPTAYAWTATPVDMETVNVNAGASSWAISFLTDAIKSGLVPPLTDNPTYQDAITREQFAELAVQTVTIIVGKAPALSAAPTFTDCDNDNIRLAAAAGIVAGIGDGKFAPKQLATREQVATMIANAIKYIKSQTGIDLVPVPASIDKYQDKTDVSSWAVSSMGALAANGIMAGTSATTLSPKAHCTVEQSIVLFDKLYQKTR